ncbi:hypothetical protein [Bizionia paragorgiae]|uniref:hypothetical protein n=1 Tax=Bizionia paragorgiae TaxID=283786 RepID=UPI003A92E778
MTNTPIYAVKTERMDITVDLGSSVVFIQQKWKYNWKTSPKVTAWSYVEKKEFHNKADKLLWSGWSNRYTLKVSGSSNIAKKYNRKELQVNFDIKWVLNSEHWTVQVKKIETGKFNTSSVNWTSRLINLDTEDLKVVTRTKNKKAYKQYPISHEFGHAIGNTSHIKGMHSDEYKTTSSFNIDLQSRMNIGDTLRRRHIDYIITELNKMIPNTVFSIHQLL